MRLKELYILDERIGIAKSMEHFYSVVVSERHLNYVQPIKNILHNHEMTDNEKIYQIKRLDNKLTKIYKEQRKWGQAIVNLYLSKE